MVDAKDRALVLRELMCPNCGYRFPWPATADRTEWFRIVTSEHELICSGCQHVCRGRFTVEA